MVHPIVERGWAEEEMSLYKSAFRNLQLAPGRPHGAQYPQF
jgi:hypothetical protein